MESVKNTTNVLRFMSIGLFSSVAHVYSGKLLYVLKDTRIAFYTVIPNTILSVFIYHYMGNNYGVEGIAISSSIVSIYNFLHLLPIINIRHFRIQYMIIFSRFIKITLLCIISAIVVFYIKYLLGIKINNYNIISLLLLNACTITSFLSLCLIMFRISKIPEFIMGYKFLVKKLYNSV